MMIMTGNNDKRVPPKQSYELYKALKARNKPVRYVNFSIEKFYIVTVYLIFLCPLSKKREYIVLQMSVGMSVKVRGHMSFRHFLLTLFSEKYVSQNGIFFFEVLTSGIELN